MITQVITHKIIDEALYYWKKENPNKKPEGIVIHLDDFKALRDHITGIMALYPENNFALSPKYNGLTLVRTTDIQINTIKIF
jgi:hypothetical protein